MTPLYCLNPASTDLLSLFSGMTTTLSLVPSCCDIHQGESRGSTDHNDTTEREEANAHIQKKILYLRWKNIERILRNTTSE